ncbi:MAG: hypothetical protein IJF71_00115 [Clostridia bacterium]|nr:hypothetical protein [Clostridia bacterium]
MKTKTLALLVALLLVATGLCFMPNTRAAKAEASLAEGETLIQYIESKTVSGESNTLDTGVKFPADTSVKVKFTFVPEASVTRVLLIAKNFAMGTAIHDKSQGFVWVDINGADWSYRCDEGMSATVTKGEDGVYTVNAAFTTNATSVDSVYYHIYSDNGATVFSNITSYYVQPVEVKEVDVPMGDKLIQYVASYEVASTNSNLIDTAVPYPANSKINLGYTFTADANVTRFLMIAKTFAPGKDGHDGGLGFVWVDISGDTWSARCDEGMTATVTKEEGIYTVSAYFTTKQNVDTVYYNIYSDNGTSVVSDLVASYTPAETVVIRTSEAVKATAGDQNWLDTSVAYAEGSTVNVRFTMTPAPEMTSIWLMYTVFNMGQPNHDSIFGYVVISQNAGVVSTRNGEGTCSVITCTKMGGSYYVELALILPEGVPHLYLKYRSEGADTALNNYSESYIPAVQEEEGMTAAELAAAAQKLENQDLTVYSAESANALQAKINAAKSLAEANASSAEEYEAAYAEMQQAVKALCYNDEASTLLHETPSLTVNSNAANTYNGAATYYGGVTVTAIMNVALADDVNTFTVISRRFAMGSALHDTSTGYVRATRGEDGEFSWNVGEGAVIVAVTGANGAYTLVFQYVTDTSEEVNNAYILVETAGGLGTITNIRQYVKTADIPAETVYETYFATDFDADTQESLNYLFSGFTLINEDEGAMSGNAVMLNNANANLQPYFLIPATTLRVSFDLRLGSTVSEFVAIGRNFAPGSSIHDGSQGFIRMRMSGGNVTAYEAGEGASYVTKECDEDGIYHISYQFRASSSEDLVATYVFFGVSGGACIIDNFAISIPETEAEEIEGAQMESKFYAGEQIAVAYENEVMEFTFAGEVLNATEAKLFGSSYLYPAGSYTVQITAKESGIARMLVSVKNAEGERFAAGYVLPKVGAVITQDGDNVATATMNGDWMTLTLTFTAEDAWFFEVFGYQDNFGRIEGNEASIQVSAVNVYSTVSAQAVALMKAVYEAKNVEGNYTAASRENLQAAIKVAEAALADEEADFAKAIADLQAAKDALVLATDLTALNAAIAEAEALNENEYYSGPWDALSEAVAAAKLLDEACGDEAAAAAVEAIEEAIAALVKIPSAEVADALEAVIAEAQAVDATLYTEESYAVVTEKLAEAEALLQAAMPTEELMQAATAALRAAIDALEEPAGPSLVCAGSVSLGSVLAALAMSIAFALRKRS